MLNSQLVAQVLRDTGTWWRACGRTPELTVWAILKQVLNPDHSCRDVVSKLRVQQVSTRQIPVPADTTAYSSRGMKCGTCGESRRAGMSTGRSIFEP